MAQCPGCGAEVGAENTVCPACGAGLSEPTASFEPVGVAASDTVVAPAGEGPVLVVRKGPQPGERFFVDRGKLTIGRDPESDIFLNDITVSRTHAVVESKDDVVSVADAGSLNGTYINGELCDKSTVLNNGDVVQIGTFQMLFLSGPGAL
ncbi:MAG: FHA domain-containing protein [Coriobacteriia bacterium]|nr:FHA domain-containing protein [Coriobacteriia bacterium]